MSKTINMHLFNCINTHRWLWRISSKGLNPWKMWCEYSTMNVICNKYGIPNDLSEQKEHKISHLWSAKPHARYRWQEGGISVLFCSTARTTLSCAIIWPTAPFTSVNTFQYWITQNKWMKNHMCQGNHKNVWCPAELLSKFLSNQAFSVYCQHI